MSLRWDIAQIIDEIRDIHEAKTRTRVRNSRRQLGNRIENVEERIAEGLSEEDLTWAQSFVALGRAVLDGSISPADAVWTIDNPEAAAAQVEAQMVFEGQRRGLSAQVIIHAIDQLKNRLAQYAAAKGNRAKMAAAIVRIKRILAKDAVALAISTGRQIPGVTDPEWRIFQVHLRAALQRVKEWDASEAARRAALKEEEKEEEKKVPAGITIAMTPSVQVVSVSAGAVNLGTERFRVDPSPRNRQKLDQLLIAARSTLRARPNSAQAGRLREVIGNAEAALSGEAAPAMAPDSSMPLAPRRPNYLLWGGLGLGALGATVATVLLVRRSRRRKGGR